MRGQLLLGEKRGKERTDLARPDEASSVLLAECFIQSPKLQIFSFLPHVPFQGLAHLHGAAILFPLDLVNLDLTILDISEIFIHSFIYWLKSKGGKDRDGR